MSRAADKFGPCEMCQRAMELTFHHLIPRTTRSNKWFRKHFDRKDFEEGINVCKTCHNFIHRHYSEKYLGRKLNTLPKIMADPVVAKYIDWVKNRG